MAGLVSVLMLPLSPVPLILRVRAAVAPFIFVVRYPLILHCRFPIGESLKVGQSIKAGKDASLSVS